MKFIHLSDLHIGKRVNEYSLAEDQEYIFDQILEIIKNQDPDAVIIAGDIYDKSVPPTEAVGQLDRFLYKLYELPFKTFLISGNHDSAERVAFGAKIFEHNGIYFSPAYNGKISPIVMNDEYGEVNVYLLPFIKPSHVKSAFKDEADRIVTYTDAVKIAVKHMNVDESKRNIIVSHQFVTGAKTSEGSEICVGGTENVNCEAYSPFDYAALGHIHTAQNINGISHIRYCGTPLKYSFSETQGKTVTVVELKQKGEPPIISEIPLKPLRDMRTIKGSLNDLCNIDLSSYDYVRVILSDELEIPGALAKLRTYYPNIMEMKYSNRNSSSDELEFDGDTIESKSPIELFSLFFEQQNGRKLRDEEAAFMTKIIESAEEEQNASY